MNETDRIKYLKAALLIVGLIFLFGVAAHHHLAFGVGMAHGGSFLLPGDDSRDLRNTGGLSHPGFPEPSRKPEPHLVHGLVKRCSWRSNGSAVLQR